MSDRNQLFQEINEVCFAVDDVTLFLDTHPDDAEALAFFKEMAPRRKALMKQFAREYEPLTIDCICPEDGTNESAPDHWTWSDGPLPWEGGK